MTDPNKRTLGELARRLGYTNESSVQGENGAKWEQFLIRTNGRVHTTEELILKAIEFQEKRIDMQRNFWQFMHFLNTDLKIPRNEITDYIIKHSGMMEYRNKHTISVQLHRESMRGWKIEHMIKSLEKTDLYKQYEEFYSY